MSQNQKIAHIGVGVVVVGTIAYFATKYFSKGSTCCEEQKDKPLKMIISGAPASGKGTQCAKIVEKFGMVHLSTGDMLRAAIAEGTELGKKVEPILKEGGLVSDEIVIGIIMDRIQKEDCQKHGFLLDGFPRTAPQAKALLEKVEIDCFLLLECPDKVLIERACGRLLHKASGKIYHKTFNPPPEDIAAECYQRPDDTEEKMQVRLEKYHNNVDAIKDQFESVSSTVDGNRAKSEVFEDISAVLSKL